jgi:hypothetical protein
MGDGREKSQAFCLSPTILNENKNGNKGHVIIKTILQMAAVHAALL